MKAINEATHWKTSARFVVLLAGLVLVMAMAGNTNPTCQPVDPDETVCLTALDCGDAPACADNATGITFLGTWTCLDATCVPKCEPDPSCEPGDCGPGLGMPNWTCPDGSIGGPACELLVDGDCGWVIKECPDDPCDPNTDPTCCPQGSFWVAFENGWGQCMPVLTEGECWTDAHCDADSSCEGASVCPPDVWCFAPDHPGKCTPSCGDVENCGNGIDDDCDGAVDEDCTLPCEMDTTTGEYWCPDGFTCECLPDPNCPMCAVCFMGCVPVEPQPCGMLTTDGNLTTCPDGQVCDIDTCFDDSLSAAAGGVCVDKPEACYEIYAPECGCDNKTYSNDCYRLMAGVGKAYDGMCEEPCDPVINPNCCGAGWILVVFEDGYAQCMPQPAEGECWTDADCKDDLSCEGAIICPPYAYCFVADTPGKCTPSCGDEEICGNGKDDDCDGEVDEDCALPCQIDAAGNPYWCPEGYTCECLPDPNCPMCDVCYMGCVAEEPQSCGLYTASGEVIGCPAGQVCNQKGCGLRTGALGSGVCVDKPELCPAVYAPVCGCDGLAYPNDCYRLGAGAALAHEGPC